MFGTNVVVNKDSLWHRRRHRRRRRHRCRRRRFSADRISDTSLHGLLNSARHCINSGIDLLIPAPSMHSSDVSKYFSKEFEKIIKKIIFSEQLLTILSEQFRRKNMLLEHNRKNNCFETFKKKIEMICEKRIENLLDCSI